MAPQIRKPPEVPSKEKNEYIPSFISKKPIWLEPTTSLSERGPVDIPPTSALTRRLKSDSSATPTEDPSGDYLSHQRAVPTFTETSWYDRSKSRLGPAATRYRKGACENCGAMGHKAKDCLQKKRRTGARWTGRDIQQDEAQQEVRLGWDAKRDRWNGYEPQEYDEVVKERLAIEELRKQDSGIKAEVGGIDLSEQADASHEGDSGPTERYQEESDMGRNQSNSTRQLRIREDTAKYLINLDLDSARYDPKTRSLVDGGAMQDQSSKLVEEEGFVRASGDAGEFARVQRYAWEVQEGRAATGAGAPTDTLSSEPGSHGVQMHLQANPTEGAFLRRKVLEEAAARKLAHHKALIDRYGVDETTSTTKRLEPPISENEQYAEFDEEGEIKGLITGASKSQYEEDVLIGNHTTVWGSYWDDFTWGYACCQQMEKRSYCTGLRGIKAKVDAKNFTMLDVGSSIDGAPSRADGVQGSCGDADEKLRPPDRRFTERIPSREQEAKKRTLEEMRSGVDEDEMDEWRKKRAIRDDPMLNFLGSEEVAPV